jgi:glycerophosphoryl diester phosphodiesterase
MQTTSSASSDYEATNSYHNLFEREDHPLVITGHRGGFLPENTLLAFKQAKYHKIQAVELDVS